MRKTDSVQEGKEFMDRYNEAVIDTLKNNIKKNHPEKLHEFQEDLADWMDLVEDDGNLAGGFDEKFCDNFTKKWGNDFGFCGYGVHVEVAKQYPELKKQAKNNIKDTIKWADADDWREGFWSEIYPDDICHVKDGVNYWVKPYKQLHEWEKYFNIKFDLNRLNETVANCIDVETDLELPRDEDIIRQLPEEVFDSICRLKEYEPKNKEEYEEER